MSVTCSKVFLRLLLLYLPSSSKRLCPSFRTRLSFPITIICIYTHSSGILLLQYHILFQINRYIKNIFLHPPFDVHENIISLTHLKYTCLFIFILLCDTIEFSVFKKKKNLFSRLIIRVGILVYYTIFNLQIASALYLYTFFLSLHLYFI